MAKKKVIIKKQPEDSKKKDKKKAVKAERVKGKKSKKKAVKIIKEEKSSKKIKPQLTEEESERTSEEIDALELDEVTDEISAFDEETSDIEKEVLASEEEIEEEIQEERIYTVPLAKEFMKTKNWKKTKKAVKALKQFVIRHMKPEAELVYLSQEINERLWENGIKNPPRKIRIRAVKTVEGLVRVYLA
jgi:large subunit ribosomal protein L31e